MVTKAPQLVWPSMAMDRSLEKCSITILFSLMYLMMCFFAAFAQGPSQAEIWTSVPGHFSVLDGTKAWFNWTHKYHDVLVDTDFYYKGTADQPVDENILTYTGGLTFKAPLVHTLPGYDKHLRLQYRNRTKDGTTILGSAVITLDKVTPKDSGVYEAQIYPIGSPTSKNEATMEVVLASDLQYSITVDEMTFELSVEENGTDLTLPGSNVTVPDRLLVTVSTVGSSVRPQIQIDSVIGSESYPESPCEDLDTCASYVPFFTEHAEHEEASIEVTIDFGIQNLDLIHVTLPVYLQTQSDSGKILSDGDRACIPDLPLVLLLCHFHLLLSV